MGGAGWSNKESLKLRRCGGVGDDGFINSLDMTSTFSVFLSVARKLERCCASPGGFYPCLVELGICLFI